MQFPTASLREREGSLGSGSITLQGPPLGDWAPPAGRVPKRPRTKGLPLTQLYTSAGVGRGVKRSSHSRHRVFQSRAPDVFSLPNRQ